MDRYDKMCFMQFTAVATYVAVATLVPVLFGPVVGLVFIAVTMAITSLGFYGSILKDEKKKRETRIF